MDAIRIERVGLEDRKAIRRFVKVPWSIYGNCSSWIPPLVMERMMHLSPSNPYFIHSECRFWIAYRGNEPVGRISAQIDSLHLERYGDDTGFWGMIEGENNPGTFMSLLAVAENWLASRGMKMARGPFSLSINQECGLLIEGFDTPPSMMMGHAMPWYADNVEASGYVKAKDLIAYALHVKGENNDVARLLGKDRKDIRTRSVDLLRLSEEMDAIFKIFNDAWSENWGFLPFTREEYQDIGQVMRFLADRRLVRIAEIDGEPAAFIVVLHNFNEVIRDLDGSLFPTGWIRLLWRMKFLRPSSARVLLMGVLRKYRDTMAGAALTYSLFRDIRRALSETGIGFLELSWILEDNMRMRSIIEALGGKPYKTYRIYEKRLHVHD